jgi:hypothetical protein
MQFAASRNTSQNSSQLWLLVIAFLVRLAVLILTVDIPGDGPTHAMIGYGWSRSPYWASFGAWLPGFTYLAGAMTLVVNNPLVAPRLLNLILGSLTVPVFFALVQHIYGPAVALLSAALLVVLPLHVGLSVSSLTEVSYLFEIMAALLCVVRASQTKRTSSFDLGLFVLFLVMAEMTRYEAWVLAPLLLAYQAWGRRNVSVTIILGLVLLAFPLLWSIGNYRHFGDAFYGFSAAAKPLEAAQEFDGAAALATIADQMAGHVGWILPISALVGLGVGVVRLVRGRASAEQVCFLALIALCWAVLLRYAMAVGTGFWDRYALLGYVVLLPLSALGYGRCFGLRRGRLIVGYTLMAGMMLAAYAGYGRTIFVTRKHPTQIIEIATWLRSSPYRDDAILLTKMDWESTYLPLYYPPLIGRYLIVSVWESDDAIHRFVRDRRPSLLITRASDVQERSRIERILGATVPASSRLHIVGEAEAYALSRLVGEK